MIRPSAPLIGLNTVPAKLPSKWSGRFPCAFFFFELEYFNSQQDYENTCAYNAQGTGTARAFCGRVGIITMGKWVSLNSTDTPTTRYRCPPSWH